MLLTIKCMGVAFLAGFLIGVPLVWLARRGKPLSSTDWLYAPFVGLGATTLLTHQLAYFDVRVAWSAPAILAVVSALWLALGFRYGWRTPFRRCPWAVLGVMLAVYIIHGVGLLLHGPDRYVGRMHFDRFNYISLAQFLIDVPFSTTWEQLGQRPYLADGMKLKEDRIGVMALHAFMSVSCGEWANRTFVPTILLGPALVVPALVLIARRLRFGRAEAIIAAAVGGLMPALTTLHTCCFLANVTAIPFFLAAVAATCTVVAAPSARRISLAAVLFAATVSLYTEFTLLICAIVGGAAVFAVLVGRCGWWRTPLVLTATVGLALSIYPRSEDAMQLEAVRRSLTDTSKGNAFCWMKLDELPGAVWVSDVWSIRPPEWGRLTVTVIGVTLSIVGILGVIRLVLGARAFRRPLAGRPNGAAVMALLIACILCGSLVLLFYERYQYQGFKLCLSFAPLLALGVVAALRPRERSTTVAGTNWPWHAVAAALRPAGAQFAAADWPIWRRRTLAAVVAVCGLGTCAVVVELTENVGVPASDHQLALDPWMGMIKTSLRSTHDENIVLALGPGMAYNGEASFAARRHRVWLVCPQINDGHSVGCTTPVPSLRPLPEGRQLVDLNTVPAGAYVFTLTGPKAPLVIEGDKRLVETYGPYRLWQVGPGPYRLVATEHALRPPELDHPSPPKQTPKP